MWSKKFQDLKESICIEGKKAETTLPKSIWETYSAFANTLGGDIILGVDETKERILVPTGVLDVDGIMKDLWSTLNNKQKVSVNLLSEKDVEIIEIDEKSLIIIHVPAASRELKPVYINNNLQSGSYRRNGDGDYHCTSLEINNMLRDQSEQTQDYKIIERFTIEHINQHSLASYRSLFKIEFPNHPWTDLDDEEFLYRISGIDKDVNGKYRLTEAGLFMFSNDYEIEKAFPDYFLDYREMMDSSTKWTNRIHSGEGSWSGNLYDFFFLIMPYLSSAFKNPFDSDTTGKRVGEAPAVLGVREAFINCICNANFYDTYGIVIKRYPNKFVFENPGILRIPVEKAIVGGNSNPRNKAIMKMFSLIGYGERAGSGIPNIFEIWKTQQWPEPRIIQEFNHDRTILELKFSSIDENSTLDLFAQPIYQTVYQFMQQHEVVKTKDIMQLLEVKEARARQILKEMTNLGFISALGANRNRVYQIKKR